MESCGKNKAMEVPIGVSVEVAGKTGKEIQDMNNIGEEKTGAEVAGMEMKITFTLIASTIMGYGHGPCAHNFFQPITMAEESHCLGG